MKTAYEFYKEETGYCEEAMKGVFSRTLTMMEKYANYRIKEQAKLHLGDVKNLIPDSPARQNRISQLKDIINA
jgi:hypothetical protein